MKSDHVSHWMAWKRAKKTARDLLSKRGSSLAGEAASGLLYLIRVIYRSWCNDNKKSGKGGFL